MTPQETQFYSQQVMSFFAMQDWMQSQQVINSSLQEINQLIANNKIQQLESQNYAYMLMLAQQAQIQNVNLIGTLTPVTPAYAQQYIYPILNCCCEETFNKLSTSCAEREQIVEYNLNSCVQAFPHVFSDENIAKVSLKKTDHINKGKSKLLNALKALCVLTAFLSRFDFNWIGKLIIYLAVTVLLLVITAFEKNQK